MSSHQLQLPSITVASMSQFQKERAKLFSCKRWLRALMMFGLCLILLVELMPGSANAESIGLDDTRKWSSGVGLWGKRSSIFDDHQESPSLRSAFMDTEQGTRFVQKRPEDTWNKLNSLWGKRSSSSNWQTATGLWGKRSYPARAPLNQGRYFKELQF